ncbi:MAG: hypothetical protein SPL59_07665 [Catonella sp.]|nr:hypothetical protein [Catonella sp.]
MSAEAKEKLISTLDGVSDDNIYFLIQIVNRYMKGSPSAAAKEERPIGMYKDANFYDHNWDIDEDNEKIAMMFGEIG